MHIVPRIDRAQRRDLVRTGDKTGDVATLKRFYAVALLGAGKSSPTVADLVCVAASTVVRAARACLAGGVEALYDKRLRNGRPPRPPDRCSRAFEQRTASSPSRWPGPPRAPPSCARSWRSSRSSPRPRCRRWSARS